MGVQKRVSERVLATPELLEAILIHLPLRDLLVHAQLISRTWKHTISQSPNLQRALFFSPQPYEPNALFKVNPLLEASFQPWFNNVLAYERSYPCWSDHHAFRVIDWNSSDVKKKGYARHEASWRRMLVVQPPVYSIEIVRLWSGWNPLVEERGMAECDGGVRMGLLYDLVQERRSIPKWGLSWGMIPVLQRTSEDSTEHEKIDMDEEQFSCDGSLDDVVHNPLEKAAANSGAELLLPRDHLAIMFHTFVGCIPTTYNMIGSVFKSEGYEKVDIEFRQVKSDGRWNI